jgi:serine/threonine-protein kinase RsbW
MYRKFNLGTLRELRRAVRARAASAGMPGSRAADVALAVHELAANAIRHGGGSGGLQLQATGARLVCQVSDSGSASPGSPLPRVPSRGTGSPGTFPGRCVPGAACGSSFR